MNKVFWVLTALDAALFVFLLGTTLRQPEPSSGGREMALAFSVLLPAVVLAAAVCLFLFSSSQALRMIAVVIVAGPGLLLSAIRLRSAYLDHAAAGYASGSGYFQGKANREMAAAIVARDPERVARAKAAGADVNAAGEGDMTMLRLAVEQEFDATWSKTNAAPELPVIKKLIALGAKPDAALEPASKLRDSQVLRLLLDAGGDPNVTISGSPLAFAWMNILPADNLRLLIEHGAHVDAKDISGTPLLVSAAMERNWECARVLLEKNADTRATDAYGRTLWSVLQDAKADAPDEKTPAMLEVEKLLEGPGTKAKT